MVLHFCRKISNKGKKVKILAFSFLTVQPCSCAERRFMVRPHKGLHYNCTQCINLHVGAFIYFVSRKLGVACGCNFFCANKAVAKTACCYWSSSCMCSHDSCSDSDASA